MAGGGTGDGDFGLQIAPMLDILFVLLLFFMVSAGTQKKEASISTQLPGGQPGNDVTINIALDANNQVSLNEVPMDVNAKDDNLVELQAHLTAMLKSNPKQPVIITPDRSATHQHVVDILNACAGAGVTNLAFGSPSG